MLEQGWEPRVPVAQGPETAGTMRGCGRGAPSSLRRLQKSSGRSWTLEGRVVVKEISLLLPGAGAPHQWSLAQCVASGEMHGELVELRTMNSTLKGGGEALSQQPSSEFSSYPTLLTICRLLRLIFASV